MNTELENSQGNQESRWGGSRPGAGRKSMNGGEEVTRKMRRKFEEYISEEQVEGIVAGAVADAMNGKPEMIKFVLEQVFGKATQRQEHTGADGAALQIVFDEAFKLYGQQDTKPEV